MRIDRMLALIVMLLNKERITAREIADKFEVSVRTIYRDVEAINLAGIPVITFSGNHGGFGIMENYKIDRQLLTLNDMFTILSALKGVNTGLRDIKIESAMEKIISLIPKEKTHELNLHFDRLVLDIVPWGYRDKRNKMLKRIQTTIEQDQLIEIKYSNLKGDYWERIIEPMTLLLKGPT